MNRSAKTVLPTLAVLLGPAAALVPFYLMMQNAANLKPLFIGLHVLTFLWVALFFRRKICRASVLPASFLASLLMPYLYDTVSGGWLRYLGTAVVFVFYALPWTAITLIVAVVLLLRDRQKRKGSIQYNVHRNETEG